MSLSTISNIRVHGENLPWVMTPVLMILGLVCTLQATLLFFPRQESLPAPPVSAALAPVIVTETVKECAPVFAIGFEHGNSTGDRAVNYYQTLAQWMNNHPEALLIIQGFSDSSGDEFTNMALSHRRAESVKESLERAGLTNMNISVQAFGEYSPLPGDHQPAANQRRVTLQVAGFSPCTTKDRP